MCKTDQNAILHMSRQCTVINLCRPLKIDASGLGYFLCEILKPPQQLMAESPEAKGYISICTLEIMSK